MTDPTTPRGGTEPSGDEREQLARVSRDSKEVGATVLLPSDYRAADAVLDHLRSAGQRHSPGTCSPSACPECWDAAPPAPATDGLRAEVVLLCNEAENLGAGRDGDDCWVNVTDLRAALAAAGQPETADRPAPFCDDDGCLHYDHEPAGEPGDGPLREALAAISRLVRTPPGVEPSDFTKGLMRAHAAVSALAVPPAERPS